MTPKLRTSLFGFVIALAMVLPISSFATTQPADSLFARGNELYKNRQYDSAIAVYNQVANTGEESAPLYFNLGNAHFRNGDLGHAILYYLRAERLDPGDDDIRANLAFARRYTTVQMEGVQLNPISSFVQSLVAPYFLSTLAWIASAFFILFFVFLILRYGLVIRTSATKAGVIVALILLVVASVLTTAKYNFDYLTNRGVIVAEKCVVLTGPSPESEKELDAAPGLIVEILDESGDYYNVLFENKRRGWVKKDLVAVV